MNPLDTESIPATELQEVKARAAGYRERALRMLRNHGCRITSPRTEVIRALSELKAPITAYHLHELVKQKGGKADVVSIYRILDTLKGYGLVYHVGSMNAYFPVFLEHASDRLSELCIREDTNEVIELSISPVMLQAIESQAKALGVAITSIKIELLARDIS